MEATQQREELIKTAIMMWFKNYDRLGDIYDQLDEIKTSMVKLERCFIEMAGVRDLDELTVKYFGCKAHEIGQSAR